MKLNKLFLIPAIAVYLVLASCSKGHDKPADGDNHKPLTQYPAPGWQVKDASTLAYSMTAVIAISDSIKQAVSNNDEVAAFIGDECRGVGVYVERDTAAPVFYVLIKGAADELGSLSFKYYNKSTKYMYSTGNILDFEIDDNYGTVDEPEVPEFKPM